MLGHYRPGSEGNLASDLENQDRVVTTAPDGEPAAIKPTAEPPEKRPRRNRRQARRRASKSAEAKAEAKTPAPAEAKPPAAEVKAGVDAKPVVVEAKPPAPKLEAAPKAEVERAAKRSLSRLRLLT